MNKLKAIKILHDITNRRLYNLISEYFRMVGAYIGEGIIDEYTDQEFCSDDGCFQIFICISATEPIRVPFLIKSNRYIYVQGLQDQGDELDAEQILKDLVGEVSDIAANRNFFYFPSKLLEALIPIYIGKNLCKASFDLQYYRKKLPIHSFSENAYRSALIELKDIEVCEEEKCWYAYAILYCKQKLNLSCFYQIDKLLAYPVTDLAEECQKLIDAYPAFSNAKVLLGMIYEISHNNIKDAVRAYKEALDAEGKNCYSSHIFYWIGKLYEKYEDCHEDARFAYESAYRFKKKYRNIYKIAFMARIEKNYEEEIKYYKECVEMLQGRQEKFMDPLEMEYYFKVCLLIAYVSLVKLENYEEVITYAQKAVQFVNGYMKTTKVFEWIFGEEKDSYHQLTRKKMCASVAYEYLGMAYMSLGCSDQACQYWDLSEQEKKNEE